MLKAVFGLANSSAPYNFNFETTPGASAVIVQVTLPQNVAAQDYALSSSNPIAPVSLSSGNSSCNGQLVLKDGGQVSSVEFVGSLVQANVAQCDFDGAVSSWVPGP